MVDVLPLADEDCEELKQLLRRHRSLTQSALAKRVLSDFGLYRPGFLKVLPRGYERARELGSFRKAANG